MTTCLCNVLDGLYIVTLFDRRWPFGSHGESSRVNPKLYVDQAGHPSRQSIRSLISILLPARVHFADMREGVLHQARPPATHGEARAAVRVFAREVWEAIHDGRLSSGARGDPQRGGAAAVCMRGVQRRVLVGERFA